MPRSGAAGDLLAKAIKLDQDHILGGNERMAARKTQSTERPAQLDLPNHLPGSIIFLNGAAAIRSDEQMPIGQQRQRIGGEDAGRGCEAPHLFAGSVPLKIRSFFDTTNAPIAEATGRDDPTGVRLITDDFTASGAVYFQQLSARDNKSTTIRQTLDVDGRLGQFFLPQDLTLEVAFGNALAIMFGDQHAAARQHLGVQRGSQARDLPARLAVAVPFDDAIVMQQNEQRVAELAFPVL